MSFTSEDVTKKVCVSSFAAIILILVFIFVKPTGTFYIWIFKVLIVIIIGSAIYLNQCQTNNLHKSENKSQSAEYSSQLTTNILCGYMFSFSLILLMFFIISFKHISY